ncbi:MAG: hypothetical protein ACQES2_00980 [Pseudomonadota bacterium]
MIKRLHTQFLALILLALPQFSVADDALFESVIVNGLTDGKAILSIDGQLHMLDEGDRVKGFHLVRASNSYALVEREGVERKLFLREARAGQFSDNFVADSDALTGEQSELLASRILAKADSHIIDVEEVRSEDHSAAFRLEYFYNGSHGEKAFLKVFTYQKGRPTGLSASTFTRIYPGRNSADVEVRMAPDAPREYDSQAIQFEIVGEQRVEDSYRVLSKRIPYDKHWVKPKPKSRDPFIGNTEWKITSPSP